MLLTGLAFYSPHLYWIATILGGAATSRFWHPWLGVAFRRRLLVWMLRAWRGDMRITAVDRQWGESMQHYIRNEDEDLPPIDRFNLGQKYFFWANARMQASCCCSRARCYGSPSRFRGACAACAYAAVLLHVASALVTIGLFIIHVYMGTAVVRGGFTSIIRGEVSPAWARTHHRLWYHRVTGK